MVALGPSVVCGGDVVLQVMIWSLQWTMAVMEERAKAMMMMMMMMMMITTSKMEKKMAEKKKKKKKKALATRTLTSRAP